MSCIITCDDYRKYFQLTHHSLVVLVVLANEALGKRGGKALGCLARGDEWICFCARCFGAAGGGMNGKMKRDVQTNVTEVLLLLAE